MMRPLISIVTPVLNRVGMIGAALDSVGRAGAVPTEHLVVDGGSTDGTASLLRNRPGIRLIEAPGTGIYDALNLGLHAARGDIICQLNSDDLLSRGSLECVAEADVRAGTADAVRGRALYFAEDAGLAALCGWLQAGLRVHVADQPLKVNGVAFGKGSLIVRLRDNPETVHATVSRLE